MVIGAYLVYAVFDDWSYLRFLLPAMAVLAVFTAVELSAWIGRWPPSYRAPILFALALLVTAHGIWVARSLDTFKLADQLRRVSRGRRLHQRRRPARRCDCRWRAERLDALLHGSPDPAMGVGVADALAAAIATLEQSRRPVYVVLDAWEHEPFRAKFGCAAGRRARLAADAGRGDVASNAVVEGRRSRAIRPRRELDDHSTALRRFASAAGAR